MTTTTTPACGWRTGTEPRGAAPALCGKPAKSRSTEAVTAGYTETAEVCGVHARSAAAHGLFVELLPRPDVRLGQVYADNDQRQAGRTLRVDGIEADRAICTILTNSDETQEQIERIRDWYRPQDMRGKTVRIKLARFVSNSTGYRLVQDVEG
jgi:hypothetical protein